MVPFHACQRQGFLTFVKVTNAFDNLMRVRNSLLQKSLTDVVFFCVGANSLRESQDALKPDLGLSLAIAQGAPPITHIILMLLYPTFLAASNEAL